MKKIINLKNELIKFIKNYPIFIYFIVGNFLNALLLRLFTTGSFKLTAALFDLGFVLLIGSLAFFVKASKRNLYYVCSSIFLIAICIVNSIYYNYYTSFVSASLLATSVFIKDVGDTVVELAISFSDWIYLWVLIGLYVLIKKKKDKVNTIKKLPLKIFCFAFLFLCMGSIMTTNTSWGRFVKLWNRVLVVNNFGVYVYQMDDFVQSLTPAFNNLFGYDNALKNTSEYYQENKNEKVSNDYTGIFEGKNVIAIHAESLQTFTLGLSFEGKEVTPNLNKLIKEGMFFSNFYAQVGVGTSSDSEFTYATSLLPANSGTVFVNYFNNKFVTIQQLLNDKGYYTFSMHGNVGDFWNRDTMHLNMGYDKFYSKSSFEIDEEFGLGLSDKSFFRQIVPMIKDIEENVVGPYYGTLITLTNHTPWKDTELYSDYKVTKTIDIDGTMITRDYLEGKTIGNYIKTVNYMDSAIGQFLMDMESEGLLDNTVIVIYGDHDARLNKEQYDYMYNYDPITDRVLEEGENGYVEFNDYDYELNKNVPFIIWTKDMKKGIEIDTPMGMIDVMPTLGNMLNVHNQYALGRDIMNINKDDAIVVFKDGSYITDKVYYSAKTGDAYTISNGIINENYINDNSIYADKIIEISDNIITYDLIKDLK